MGTPIDASKHALAAPAFVTRTTLGTTLLIVATVLGSSEAARYVQTAIESFFNTTEYLSRSERANATASASASFRLRASSKTTDGKAPPARVVLAADKRAMLPVDSRPHTPNKSCRRLCSNEIEG